jgi:hypothetical protein
MGLEKGEKVQKDSKVEKSHFYYSDDGYLVIKVRNGSVLTVFLVHSKILTLGSQCFKLLLVARSQWAELDP